MVCLDSDIIIDFLKEKEHAVKIIKKLQDNHHLLSTTSVNTFELYKGIIKNQDTKSIDSLDRLLNNLKIYNFDLSSSKKAADIFENLKLKGEIIDLADIMIASIALANNETLLTNNKKYFQRINELAIGDI